MGKITVVIPNYNGIKYIQSCLKSLENQTIEKFYTIVVDNGSTDGSCALIREQFPDVQLVELSENLGFSAAVNKGIELSNSKYVLLLNNDTVAEADFLEEMERAIDESSMIFSVSAKMIQMKDANKIDGAGDRYCALGWAYARYKDKDVHNAMMPCHIFSACAGAAIYRRDLLNKIGLFDCNHFAYLEDLDIGYRAKIYGYENHYAPNAKVYHVGSGASGSRYNEFKISLSAKNNVYLLYKNMPILQLLLNLPLLLIGFLVKYLFFLLKGYGKVYAAGLLKGIKFCFTEEAKSHKVRFQVRNLSHYFKIQLELWLRCLVK